MRLLSIASGSSGNCIYIGDDTTHVLVDVGIPGKRICDGLVKAGLEMKDISGILVTHEHSDHIRSVGVISRKYGIPVYATAETVEAIKKDSSLGDYDKDIFICIGADADFMIGSLSVHPFSIYHDAADPVGYRVSSCGRSAAVSTDIGHYDDYLVGNLSGLDCLLVEANHDVKMLEAGPYPYYLKRRILGEYGHLSNENSGKLISSILHDGLKQIVLGHLSRENNYPQIAYSAVCLEIQNSENRYSPQDFRIEVAGRDRPGNICEF